MVSVLGIHLPDSPDKITCESMTERYIATFTLLDFLSKFHINIY